MIMNMVVLQPPKVVPLQVGVKDVTAANQMISAEFGAWLVKCFQWI